MSRSLGEVIRHRRAELGLTQRQLAERVGRSQVAVSEWERNVVVPSDLHAVADALGLRHQQLAMVSAATFLTDDHFEQAIWQAERLTMKQREALVTIYKGLVSQNVGQLPDEA